MNQEPGRKKIILAAEIFPPDIGGPATYAQEFFEKFKKENFLVHVLCYGEAVNGEKDITRISRKQNIFFRYAKYIFMLMKLAQTFDIIYAQGPISSGIPTYLVHNIFRKKYMVKVVGDYAWETAQREKKTGLGIDDFQQSKTYGKIRMLQYLERLIVKYAEKIIVPSEYLKRIVTGWGADENKIEVIYNGFTPPEKNVGKNYNSNLIVSIGRLVPWKGFDALIELMPKLLLQNSNFQLMIFGDGPERQSLERLIEKNNLKDRISITCLRRQEIMKQLSVAGIFVLNTGYEGLSHTILEALSAGVPVITTRIGGNPEIIEHGINGFLVGYNNKEEIERYIFTLFRHPELREKFSENSRIVFEKFDSRRVFHKIIQVIGSIKL